MIILRPIINEKSMAALGQDFYTFAVSINATKEQVARVVTEKFKVDVLTVRMVTTKGKKKLQRSRRGYYQTADSKKAIVKLKKGQKIALFEVSPETEDEEIEVRTAEGEVIAKEKKSLLKGTKVKIEKESKDTKETKKKKGDK